MKLLSNRFFVSLAIVMSLVVFDANRAFGQAKDTKHGMTIVGLKCLQNPGKQEIMLKYRVDGTGMGGAWDHRVLGDQGVKNPGPGQIWKTSKNYHRFKDNFHIEFYQLKPYKYFGSLTVQAADAPGRKTKIIESGGVKVELVYVKDDLQQPHVVRGYNGRYFPPKAFSFFGNIREPIPQTIPVGKQSQGSCVAWSISAVLGTQVLNTNSILKSGELGFDRRGFMKKGLQMLDAQDFFNKRGFSADGWNIPDALNKAMLVPIKIKSNPKYGVKIKSWTRVRNADQARWLLSREIPLVADYTFTNEINAFRGKNVFMGSVDETRQRTGHAVAVVGYNNPWAGREIGVPYWEVQNSWGKDWGRKGYFLMKPGASDLDDVFYYITNFSMVEIATGNPISGRERNQVLTSIVGTDRQRVDLNFTNITAQTRFAEDADQIRATVTESSSQLGRKVGLRLTTPRNMTWYKAVKVYRNNRLFSTIWTQDNKSDSGVLKMPVNATDTYHIEFVKAKTFGVRTAIKKHSIDLFLFQGHQVDFSWTRD